MTLTRARGSVMTMRSRVVITALVFIAPAAVLFAVFRIWPVFDTISLSLTDWNGFSDPKFVGLDNYVELLGDGKFRQSVLNTFLILLCVPIYVFIPFLVATLLATRVFLWKVFRLLYFTPALISAVVAGFAFNQILGSRGLINQILGAIGLESWQRAWTTDASTALIAIIVVLIWATFGTGVLIFLAALGSVEQEQIDAARLDGAGWFRIQRSVVLPAIRPVVEFWTVIVTISVFGAVFPIVYALTGGGPGYATYTIDFDVYQQAFLSGRPGFSTAIATVGVAMTAIVVGIQLFLFRRSAR